jgi:hypothetical protein
MERAPRQPRLALRAPGWAAAGAVVLGLVWASAARSDTDFGTLGFDRGEFGSLVSLSTPSSRLYQEADEFVVHRTVVQSPSSVEPGLIQAGVYRSGPSIELDNCGTSAGYVVFSEVKAQGSMAYRCQLYQAVAPGRAVTLDIFRFHAAATWGIRIDGRSTGSIYPLGFNRGLPAIGSEIDDVDFNDGTHTATRFGLAGHAPWNVYTTVGRSRPHAVRPGDPVSSYPTSDVHWRRTGPPGRPTIRHRQ